MLGLSTKLYDLLGKVMYSKSFLLVLVGALVAIAMSSCVGSASDTVGGWFGKKDVAGLESEIKMKDHQLKELNQANQEKDIQREMLTDVITKQVNSVVDVSAKDVKVVRSVSKISTKRQQKIVAIQKASVKDEIKIVEESIVVLESLHDVYCAVEPNCVKGAKS